MATKLELKLVEHTNNIGQTIRPGDEIVIVTTGYSHRVSIKRGVYLGKKNDGCSCRVIENHIHYRHKETGVETPSWYNDPERLAIPMPKHPGYPQPAPRWNSPEYAEYQAEVKRLGAAYNTEYAEYQAKVQAVYAKYEPFKVPYNRYTTLQLNRIYKLDTKAYDMLV